MCISSATFERSYWSVYAFSPPSFRTRSFLPLVWRYRRRRPIELPPKARLCPHRGVSAFIFVGGWRSHVVQLVVVQWRMVVPHKRNNDVPRLLSPWEKTSHAKVQVRGSGLIYRGSHGASAHRVWVDLLTTANKAAACTRKCKGEMYTLQAAALRETLILGSVAALERPAYRVILDYTSGNFIRLIMLESNL